MSAERPFRPGSDEEKLFLAAVKMIPRHYRSFDMGAVMEDLDELGTVCCFAAFVALLAGIDLAREHSAFWTDIGPKRLRLTKPDCNALFFPVFWPNEFCGRLRCHKPRTPEYAAVAHERFMHFYRTGE